jgi:hypothetical protein
VGHLKIQCPEKAKETTCIRCSQHHSTHFTECKAQLKCANCGKDHAACAKICEHLIKYQEQEDSKTDKRIKTNSIRINSAAPMQTSNNAKNEQLQYQPTQNLIYASNLTIIRFIIEILRSLNEMISSVNENPQLITSTIAKFFSEHLALALQPNLLSFVDESSYDSETSNEDNNVNEINNTDFFSHMDHDDNDQDDEFWQSSIFDQLDQLAQFEY